MNFLKILFPSILMLFDLKIKLGYGKKQQKLKF